MRWLRILQPRLCYRHVRRRLTGRGDTEHEQALVRIAIVGLLLAYALVGPLPASPALWWVPTVPQLGVVIWTLSLLHFAWIVADPAVRRFRRALWSGVDHVGIVLAMAVGGEAMALLYPLMLWVTLGHGFRYGSVHLIGSALVSVALFLPLVTLHPFWQLKGALAIGLVLGLILIPAYCLRLLQHLHEARRRAEASSEAKSRFLATMSHELRTPLHAVLGMAELLRATPLRPDQREMTRTIHTAGHGLLNMIDDVLDLARIEAGATSHAAERVDLHRVLHEIRDMLAHRAHAKGLAFRLRLDARLPAEIEGPRQAINQILVNLATNALKFTDTGEVRIEAGIVVEADTTTLLRLAVVDTGCGIPAGAQQRVFESFAQADETTTRRHGGSGLGLAIVKRLVEGAGGDIRLESDVGRGTRFEVRLPVTPAGDALLPPRCAIRVHGEPTPAQRELLATLGVEQQVPGDAEQSGFISTSVVDLWCRTGVDAALGPRGGRDLVVWGEGADIPDALVVLPMSCDAAALKRSLRAALVVADDDDLAGAAPRRIVHPTRSLDVVVADDHEVNRQVIERMLAQAGHHPVAVTSGEAAIARHEEIPADVVVLDLNMPGMGGLTAAAHLAGAAERPRLVALTADATAATRSRCLGAGFDAFLTKPVDGTTLLAAVESENTRPASPIKTEPAKPAVASAAVEGTIDHARLDLLRQLDQGDGFLDGIIDGFIADGRGLVDEIAVAADNGEVERFRDAAHALRSAATHLGAMEVFERCLAVKGLDSEELQREATTLVPALRRTFERAANELAAARTGGGAEPAPLTPPSASSGSARDAPSFADPEVRARAPARPTVR